MCASLRELKDKYPRLQISETQLIQWTRHHDITRVTHVLATAARLGQRLRNPPAWITTALRDGYELAPQTPQAPQRPKEPPLTLTPAQAERAIDAYIKANPKSAPNRDYMREHWQDLHWFTTWVNAHKKPATP